MADDEIDRKRLQAYAKLVFGALGGAMTSAMIHLGDRLGLYQALADGEALTSHELAARSGYAERWIREWLYQQGAAGVLEHRGGGRFALAPEGRALLADESSPACGVGFFGDHFPAMMRIVERLPEAFRSGVGLPYDAFGPDGARGIERGFAPWFRTMLVPFALPHVPGLVATLETGAEVADVGCGAGVAVLEMAKAFPRSTVHGWDVSEHALARAEENGRAAGVTNARFHDAHREPMPDACFALVTTFDCLHDMTDPAGVIRRIRSAIRPDGVWLVCDIKARDTYEENAEKNPMAAMMYGSSVLMCMSSALSAPGGAGLGTLGLPASLLRRMTEEAGFTSFEPLDLGHPVNTFYVVRP